MNEFNQSINQYPFIVCCIGFPVLLNTRSLGYSTGIMNKLHYDSSTKSHH